MNGGPNDADEETNYRVVNLGGIAAIEQEEVTSSSNIKASDESRGGGSFPIMVIEPMQRVYSRAHAAQGLNNY